jgi:outer membrane protein OmpA-like peptidoglycan-associated protein
MSRAALALAAVSLAATACPSAYQRTYDRELAGLEAQEEQRQAAEAAAREEARKYVAVVYFDTGSSMIHEDGYRELSWFVDQIRPYPEAQIDVKGYADASGQERSNQKLSEERAENVARFLAQQGIAPDRIAPAGFSSNFPDRENDTAQGRSRNRRVEVRVR